MFNQEPLLLEKTNEIAEFSTDFGRGNRTYQCLDREFIMIQKDQGANMNRCSIFFFFLV